MLIARTDILLGGGQTMKRGQVVPAGVFSEPEPLVRMGKLWRIDDEALAFALEHINADGRQSTKAKASERR